jgi:hypothetical protein
MSENENIVIVFPTLEPDDISSCEEVVQQLFECIKKWQNEDEARRIFGRYGRPRTKREINKEENEKLLTEYYLEFIKAEKSKDKPNVHQLALRLAKENNVDSVALERKIWRLIKGKHQINNRDNLRRIAEARYGFKVEFIDDPDFEP